MNWDKTTLGLVAAVAGVLIIWDVFVFAKKGFEPTISWQIYTYAKMFPIIPFALGILFGHLFWTQVCM